MSWSFLDFTGLSRFFGRLPEKLVTTDTTQTIPGTKAFSSTILGSVSGSAASAAKDGAGNVIADTYETKADAATHLSKSDAAGTYLSKTDAASAYVQTGAVDQTIAGTKTFNSPINSPVTTGIWINGNRGVAIINSTANAGYNVLFRMKSSHGVFTGCAYDQSYQINYTTDSIVNAGTNAITYTNTLIDENGNATFSNNITVRGTINGNLNGNVTGNAATATTATTAESCTGNAATATTATTAESCTGNAATATKLATARTIALSGAATGTATAFDGSGNITIPVTALASSAIRAQWYAAYPDGAEAHNAMWGGRDITAAFNNGTVSANIANGTFRDIFPGDYITKQVTIPQVLADDGTTELFAGGTYTVNWVIADCDYWIVKGDQNYGMRTHHVAIVPQKPIFDARMNSTNTTEGGYAGSEMYRNVIPACATGIVSAFGSEHILTFRDPITNTVDNNVASRGYCGWTGASAPWEVWASVQCNLMTEHMVTGAPHYSSSGIDDEITTRQMSAFRLSERLINYTRWYWWLRNVVSSASFAYVVGNGAASARSASLVIGVRPFALLV